MVSMISGLIDELLGGLNTPSPDKLKASHTSKGFYHPIFHLTIRFVLACSYVYFFSELITTS